MCFGAIRRKVVLSDRMENVGRVWKCRALNPARLSISGQIVPSVKDCLSLWQVCIDQYVPGLSDKH